MTPEEAKRFFIDRIVAQSSREGLALSANERRTLDWSETEPGGVSDPELVDALADEISDEAYEQKICRLLDAAYEADIAADGEAKDSYRRAYSALKLADYYVVVMVEDALGRRLRSWWRFSG